MENKNIKIIVSVTIATFNRAELLEKVLFSLLNQSAKKDLYEIIICDSYSSDSTIEVVRKYKQNNINIKHINTTNVLAAKRNAGIKNANGNLVIFLDDDCIPEKLFIEKYISIAVSKNFNSEKCVYCGFVSFPEEWVRKSNYYKYRDSRHFNNRNYKKNGNLDYRTIVVMNMGFNRDLFVKYISAVNENFKGYGYEDQELGWRLTASGFEIKLHDANIIHYEKSGNIAGFGKKIFYSAKDGMSNLLKYSEEAAKHLGFCTNIIDPDIKYKRRIINILKIYITQLIFNRHLSNFFELFINLTDNIKIFYNPIIYRYILATYYIQGAKARFKIKENYEWYD